ncbi:SDR family NAD(P)-dependent oxidoreductase [Acidimangrovimonas sediminis]|uniref:SDR family NAD(P)-dependent oxidoreductase n=1 Tax=Acidimangrovimonas sediminis TaxID=2056283 RepID=UPI000C7FF2DF|nr:SDR family oxidoreductase [Acidimangrovimonas sediminis]
MAELTERVAIVTGGGGGLGRASALALAEKGARVAVLDLVATAAEATVAEITRFGGNAIAFPVDVASEDEIGRAVARSVQQWGRLDILVNIAAEMSPEVFAADRTVLELDAAAFTRVFTVNVLGQALMAKHALPHMIAAGAGVVINMASATGHSAELGRIMYGTSKSAIHGLTRNIATQHGKAGIRCVSVSPGVILTPGIEAHMDQAEIDAFIAHNALPRAGTARDVGQTVAFLASDAAGFITGTDIILDGGMLAHFPTVVEERERLNG